MNILRKGKVKNVFEQGFKLFFSDTECRSFSYLCINQNLKRMSKHSYFIRYATIIKELRSPKSYESLKQAIDDAYHDRGIDEMLYSRRTLQRDIEDIYELFGFEIACGSDSLYYIKTNDSAYEEINLRMIEMFDLQHSMHSQKNIEQYVQLQPSCVPGSEYIHPLIHACSCCKVVRFSYRYVWEERVEFQCVHPYGLKEFDKRWYLVAWNPNAEKYNIYGLDRIRDFEVTERSFSRDKNFSLEKFYEHYYSARIVDEDDEESLKPVTIKLLSTSRYANYLKSVPLHASQRVTEENGTSCHFELRLIPTWNFVQKLMTMADQVQVLEPDDLRLYLVDALQEALDNQM